MEKSALGLFVAEPKISALEIPFRETFSSPLLGACAIQYELARPKQIWLTGLA